MIDTIKGLMHMPVLASEHGKDVDNFIIYVHGLMVVLFVGWLAYFLYAIFRFHHSRNPKADHVGVRSHASSYLEVAVAVIEAALLIGFAIPLWAKAVEAFPPDKDSTVIRITAQQFAWNSHYPGKDGIFGKQDIKLVSAQNQFGYVPDDPNGKDDVTPPQGEIAVPVDKPVILHITSLDVIHSFALRSFRVCQDAVPGMNIPLHFKPTREGKYMITCAQLCGNSHSVMRGFFTVYSQADYDKWLASKAGASGPLE